MNEPAAMNDNDYTDRTQTSQRRSEPRWQVDLPVQVVIDGRTVPATVTSLSNGGLFMECGPPVPEGYIVVHIPAPSGDADDTILLEAEVVHHAEKGVGIRFVGLSLEDTRQLASVVLDASKAAVA